MKRLLPRPPRRRANSPEATDAHGAEVEPTQAQPVVPAGAEPPDPAAAPSPSFRNRGRLRRRLRFLRRVRELGFRDLGGLVFDQHKFGRLDEELVRGKVAALAAVDAELRALEHALAEKRDITELREPGITACPRCGTLHGSDANFCPSCGLAITGAHTIAADVGEGGHLPRPAPVPGAPGGSLAPAGPPTVESSPAAAHAGEREAAKARDETADGRDGADQPTVVARPRDRTQP
jgi:zinc-ribbon domain